MTLHEALGESIREISVIIEEHEQLIQRLEEGENAVLTCHRENCYHSRLLKETLLEAKAGVYLTAS